MVGKYLVRAMPWFRWLIVGLSPWMHEFTPLPIHVGFVVDKAALVHINATSSVFPCQYHSTMPLYTRISSEG
jgi:hypothetical protein